MARICDRSPCDPLLGALGNWMFFRPEDGFFLVVVGGPAEDDVDGEEHVEYCPFCGTRLEEVGATHLEKFMRPRRRKRVIKMALV
jgi:hypothetical protein